MYYGERKTGCRFIEVLFYGIQTLIIENSKIRAMILVGRGLNLISYVQKESDTEFVWTNPMGLSCIEKNRNGYMDKFAPSDNYAGGCFGIFPNVGNECEIDGIHFPNHSETAYLPWNYQVLKDEKECMVFEFTVKLSKYPVIIHKTLEITDDSPALKFVEKIKNIGGTDLPYLWGIHPYIGEPFLNKDCIVEAPFLKSIKFPDRGDNNNSFEIYNVNNGFADVRNPASGVGFGVSWDSNVFTNCAIWISSGAAIGHHRLGGTYALAILPMNSRCFGLDNAVKNGECKILKANEECSVWYTFTSFNIDCKPSMITKDGTIINCNTENDYDI